MKAVVMKNFGGPEVLEMGERPDPVPGVGEVLIEAKATALNGADLHQRKGAYPPPPGASDILGLEVAGEVVQLGAGVSGVALAERVMALLPGGGYAEKVVIPASLAMPIPDNFSYEEAAAIPEVFLTAFLELVTLGNLKKGETVLIHAGASGVGTAAIQIAREIGARIVVTAGSDEKLGVCAKLGAEVLINYKIEDFSERVKLATLGVGVNCILDLVGASYWAKNIASLALDGRLLLVGLGGGAKTEVDLRALLAKRAHVIGSMLRARSVAEKGELTRRFLEFAMPRFQDGRLKPVLDRVFEISQASQAHAYLESQANIGKVVLKWP